MNELTEREISNIGQNCYGLERHDAICDYFEKVHHDLTETDINNISMGVWKALDYERIFQQSKIDELKALNEQLVRECDALNKLREERVNTALEIIKIQSEAIDAFIGDATDWTKENINTSEHLVKFDEVKEKVKPLMEKLNEH
jgi:hypothetical protein